MNTCLEHGGALVVYTSESCPVCHLLTYTEGVQAKLLDLERDVNELKAANKREIDSMMQEIMMFTGRPRE